MGKKKFNMQEFREKVRKHSGEIIVAIVALLLLITLLSVSVPFLSDLFKRGAEEPTEPSHEHSYVVDNTIKPTCTEKGYSVYLCSCGDTYNADYTDPLGHDWGEWIVTKPATEDEEGTETRTCGRCGITEDRNIDKLAHTHAHSVDRVVNPTCTEKGYSVYLCKCGDTYKADYKDALGHDWSAWVITKQPTEDAEGTETRTCQRCGITESRSIDKLPHQHSHNKDKTINPTCTEKGYTVYLCKCGDTYKADYKDALGHDWGAWVITKQPTEDAEGTETRTCGRCGITESRSVDKLPHSHAHAVDSIVKPTCTEKGYSVYLCKCGDTYNADYTDALGHDWGAWIVTKPATEDEEGTETRTCGRCGITEDRSIDKLPHIHSYSVDRIKKPTCTARGYTVYVCSCGDTYKANYKDALGHDWGEWILTKPATEDEEGTETRTCGRCGITEDRSIDKLPHSHVHGVDTIIGPTCTEQGYSVYLCSCGDTYNADYTDPLGHDWGEWIVTKPATEEEEGTETRTCGRCGITEDRSIDKIPTYDWVPMEWNGLTGFDGQLIWTDGEDLYYSKNGAHIVDSTHYKFNKETNAWETKDWGSVVWFDADDVWTDGTNTYLSFYDGEASWKNRYQHYVLQDGAWVKKTWNYTSFTGGHIWRANGLILCDASDYPNPVIGLVNGTWYDATSLFSGASDLSSAFMWYDGDTVYYSLGENQYVLNGWKWEVMTWNGCTDFDSFGIWTDGEDIYLNSVNKSYILNRETNTWEPKVWTGMNEELYGGNVWTDGTNIYSSDYDWNIHDGIHYIRVRK